MMGYGYYKPLKVIITLKRREETNPVFTSMTLVPVVVFYGQILIFLLLFFTFTQMCYYLFTVCIFDRSYFPLQYV